MYVKPRKVALTIHFFPIVIDFIWGGGRSTNIKPHLVYFVNRRESTNQKYPIYSERHSFRSVRSIILQKT